MSRRTIDASIVQEPTGHDGKTDRRRGRGCVVCVDAGARMGNVLTPASFGKVDV